MATPTVAVFADLTDQTMPLLEFAEAAQDRGFSGLFLNEHTHLPVDHATSKFPPGGEVAQRYGRFWDPYIALSFVAARTSLQIGTAVSLIGEHDPIQLAHAVATLDALSDGRLVLGVGWGWNREEFANHGRPPTVRAQVVEEWVAVMRALWSNEVASYEGQWVHLTASWCWPKPRQRPAPPVLLGGPASERNFRRVARWADGWITMGEGVSRDELQRLRDIWKAAGRDDAGPRVNVVYNPTRCAPALDEVISAAADNGVERVLYHVFAGDRDQMLRRLDRGATALSSWQPAG